MICSCGTKAEFHQYQNFSYYFCPQCREEVVDRRLHSAAADMAITKKITKNIPLSLLSPDDLLGIPTLDIDEILMKYDVNDRPWTDSPVVLVKKRNQTKTSIADAQNLFQELNEFAQKNNLIVLMGLQGK